MLWTRLGNEIVKNIAIFLSLLGILICILRVQSVEIVGIDIGEIMKLEYDYLACMD